MFLERQNPMGLRFSLSEFHSSIGKGNQTKIRLVGTQKEIVIDFPIDRVSAMWYKWQIQDAMIQDAFSELPAEQREFLITGITPSEWDETFYNRVPNPKFCRNKEVCQETGKCEAIRKYDRSCND